MLKNEADSLIRLDLQVFSELPRYKAFSGISEW